MAKGNSSTPLSYDTKTIIVVLTLLFAYPIGLILMFLWMKWPKWLKILLIVPLVLSIIFFASILAFFKSYVSNVIPPTTIVQQSESNTTSVPFTQKVYTIPGYTFLETDGYLQWYKGDKYMAVYKSSRKYDQCRFNKVVNEIKALKDASVTLCDATDFGEDKTHPDTKYITWNNGDYGYSISTNDQTIEDSYIEGIITTIK